MFNRRRVGGSRCARLIHLLELYIWDAQVAGNKIKQEHLEKRYKNWRERFEKSMA